MDITMAVDQAAVADSILDDNNVVGSHHAEALAADPAEFQQAEQSAEAAAARGEDQSAERENPFGEREQQPEQEALSPDELQAMLESEQPQFQQGQEVSPEQQQFQQPTEQFQQPQTAPESFDSWRQTAYQYAQQLNSPEAAANFAFDFLSAFGVDQPTAAQFAQSPQGRAVADVMMMYAMNAIKTIMPHYFQAPSGTEGRNVLQHLVESQYEGLGEVASRESASRAWRNIAGEDRELGKLKYGSDEFLNAMQRACEIVPGLDQMQFKGSNGQPLPLMSRENLEKQFQVAARALKAGRMSPEMVRQAVQTGQRLARQSATRRQAGNLGAGNSKQQFSQQADEEFWANPQSWNQFVERKL